MKPIFQQLQKRSYTNLDKLIKNTEMTFYVLDVETANERNSSICQIGIAGFKNEEFSQAWGSYIDPKENFSYFNIQVHGITSEETLGKPTFKDVYKYLKNLENHIVVQHTGFDKSSLNNSCIKHGLPLLKYLWVDSALMAKRTWKEVSKRGYGLTDLSKRLGLRFVHHDAIEDAIVTGQIVLAAIRDSGLNISDWQKAVKKPIKSFFN
jgi:DNA polymerase-3 subunit epsilon